MATHKEVKVLIVDDEPSITKTMSEHFNLSGINTSVASNGKEALEMAKDSEFNVIITDFNMPSMNGFELIKKLTKDKRLLSTSVILIYDGSDSSDLSEAISMADWSMKKPFNFETLATELLKY
jgi:DNA-binding response OmpR family regulator